MNNQELMIVKQAIINEIEGYEFYNMASSNSNSTEVKNAFLELAQEEMQHVVWLKDLFNKVKDDNIVDFQLALIPEPTSPAIFKWENIDRKDAGHCSICFWYWNTDGKSINRILYKGC